MDGVSHQNLLEALENLAPLEFEAVKMMRECKATGVKPTNRAAVVNALRQLREYENKCERVAGKLDGLKPIPTTDEAFVWAFPL